MLFTEPVELYDTGEVAYIHGSDNGFVYVRMDLYFRKGGNLLRLCSGEIEYNYGWLPGTTVTIRREPADAIVAGAVSTIRFMERVVRDFRLMRTKRTGRSSYMECWTISVFGDPDFRLSSENRPVTFQSQLQEQLTPHRVTRHPYAGYGNVEPMPHLDDESASDVVAVWFLDELFAGGRLIGKDAGTIIRDTDGWVEDLANKLKRFPVSLVVLGVGAVFGNVGSEIDEHVSGLRGILASHGIGMVSCVDCYEGLTMNNWHVLDSLEIVEKMAAYIADLIKRRISEHSVQWEV